MSSENQPGFAGAPVQISSEEAARLLAEHVAANLEGGDASVSNLPESDSELEGVGQAAAPAHSGDVNSLIAPRNPFDPQNLQLPPLRGGNSEGEYTLNNSAGGSLVSS